METVTYLLKQIPRELWAKVKSAAYDDDLTIREWLVEAIKLKLEKGD